MNMQHLNGMTGQSSRSPDAPRIVARRFRSDPTTQAAVILELIATQYTVAPTRPADGRW